MTDPQVVTHVLGNGLTVVVEAMPAVQSAAITVLQPTGSVHDAPGKSGTAALLSELLNGVFHRDSVI
jgi:predicted Zn-dependent peptidase